VLGLALLIKVLTFVCAIIPGPSRKQEQRCAAGADNDVEKRNMEVRDAEHRQGCALWKTFGNVVSLSLNMRSDGMLSRILQEMRHGSLSDATWKNLTRARDRGRRASDGTLCHLPVTTTDEQLMLPLFSNNRMQYIVHRHVVRAGQPYINAVWEATAARRRVHVSTAADSVKDGERATFVDVERLEAMKGINFKRIKYLQGKLPLYEGMRVLLYGKPCVELGLLNGCECEVLHIIPADEEFEIQEVRAGVPIELEYMPEGIVFRSVEVDWVLPSKYLPELPTYVDRHGLFLLRPTEEILSFTLSGKSTLLIKRVQFRVVPAAVRIVYTAQGEGSNAVIIDLTRPPGMGLLVFWLACYVMLSRARSLEGIPVAVT
jgi:hypothetical protein